MLVAKAHRDRYERADGNITKKKFGNNGTMCKEKKKTSWRIHDVSPQLSAIVTW